MKHDVLLEIGTEELPARFLPPALAQLESRAREDLERLRLSHESVATLATPRRLALVVRGLAVRQADSLREVRGPSRRAAYDEAGRPTRAAEGFARGQGVSLDDLVVRSTEQGEYVYAVIRQAGRPTAEVVREWLPALVVSLQFPKSMRWGDGELRFARPIRWVVALLDDQVVPAVLDGVQAGRQTWGHRFLAPGPHAVSRPAAYEAVLLRSYVVADPGARRDMVRRQVEEVAAAHGGQALIEESLLEEVTNLVEFPEALCGSFAPEYLELPREVLVTPMRGHQRYFPMVDRAGRLMNKFVAVSNGAGAHADVVRAGNEKVLAARLADARFFFEEDLKRPLADRLGDLKAIVFQESLGTVYDKVQRVVALTDTLAAACGVDAELRATARRAAHLAKADLATHMVYEFPELQGIMGREYAARGGESPAVAQAIFEHYLPRFAGDALPEGLAGALVGIADRLDTIVGCFGIGLVPTGSQDPYALRRQALGVIHLLLHGNVSLTLSQAFQMAREGYGERLGEGDGLTRRLMDFFQQRVRGVLAERGVRYDVIEAVVKAGIDSLPATFRRASALAEFSRDEDFGALITAFQRVANLAVQGDSDAVSEDLLCEPAEQALFRAWQELAGDVEQLTRRGEFLPALRRLAQLRPAVDAFFTEVLVMTPDPGVRRNRLALLRRLTALFHQVADLREIVA